ncbi:MAG TPA: glycosyltransferase [Kiritimatiellia bacterium]|nr:glycosyltransferase [Kiritimatiellia bacterium]
MRLAHLKYLVCPDCRTALSVSETVREDDRLVEGQLRCDACGQAFPVVRGIPRFVPAANYASSFGFEWTQHARTQYDSYTGSHITEHRFFAETRWPRDMSGQVILEVGSGSGRFTEQAASTGATVVSMDYSSAVEANFASNGRRDNVLIVQGNLYHMPFPLDFFDKLLCIGVLQHTPNVEASFRCLPRYLKPGGEIVVDVYAKMRGLLSFVLRTTSTKEVLRHFTPKMKAERLYELCRRYIKFMWPLARIMGRWGDVGAFLLRRLMIPPYFGVYDLPEYHLREWIILDMFDILSPAYDQPQQIDTVREWFEKWGLEKIDVQYGYNGIEGRGTRDGECRRLSVALMASTFLPRLGGAEITVHNLAARLKEAGQDVTLITWWGLWRRIFHRVKYRSLPLLPKSYTHYFEKLLARGRDIRWVVALQVRFYQFLYRFDVWHLHMAYPGGVLVAGTLRRLGVPFVTTCHGDDIMTFPLHGYGARLRPGLDGPIREALQASDYVTAISPTIRGYLEEFGVPVQRIRDIPNGVDVSRIQGYSCDRPAVRKKLGWDEDKFVILSVGRNDPMKGFGLIPQIIGKICATRNDFLWVVVGPGHEHLEGQVQALNLGAHLRVYPRADLDDVAGKEGLFAVPTDALISMYKAADIFVFPSAMEACPLVLIEAMAAGLPIVTTDAPGCRDVAPAGAAALASPVGDVEKLVANIQRLMEDRGLRDQLVRGGAELVREYDWPVIVRALRSLYSEAYRNPSQPVAS